MKVEYRLLEDDFFVGEKTLREFYISMRKASGMSVATLEKRCGLDHPTLYSIEKRNSKGYQSNSIRAMLIALLALDFDLKLDVRL